DSSEDPSEGKEGDSKDGDAKDKDDDKKEEEVAADCEAGQYIVEASTATAEATCAACPSGTFSEADSTECQAWTVCEAGNHVSGKPSESEDRACTKCEEGTQTTGDNQSTCLAADACQAGSVQTDAATDSKPA